MFDYPITINMHIARILFQHLYRRNMYEVLNFHIITNRYKSYLSPLMTHKWRIYHLWGYAIVIIFESHKILVSWFVWLWGMRIIICNIKYACMKYWVLLARAKCRSLCAQRNSPVLPCSCACLTLQEHKAFHLYPDVHIDFWCDIVMFFN